MNNMPIIFTKMLTIGGREKMHGKIEEESVLSMIYMLESLSCRGLSIRETVRKNLKC